MAPDEEMGGTIRYRSMLGGIHKLVWNVDVFPGGSFYFWEEERFERGAWERHGQKWSQRAFEHETPDKRRLLVTKNGDCQGDLTRMI
jgi:hypothetical protein